jgi:metal-responsive CopG/Arc/MetJ family transcriptional regulator
VPKPLKFPTKLLIGFDDRLLRAIDDWRRKQEDLPPRTEAIRRLIEKALQPADTRSRKK